MKYKFLNLKRNKIVSNLGNMTWKIGKWNHVDGELSMCNSGLHCSRTPYQAFSFIQGEVLAIVETKGKSIIQDDKECWSDMKILKAYKWTKKDSVAFAIYVAELVIDIYEKEYPDDKRPRKAIEVAKKVLFHDTAKNRAAAWDAAWAVRDAAWAAAWAAWAAARDAAWAAAWAARDAALAAMDAARDAIYRKCGQWMVKRIKNLKQI